MARALAILAVVTFATLPLHAEEEFSGYLLLQNGEWPTSSIRSGTTWAKDDSRRRSRGREKISFTLEFDLRRAKSAKRPGLIY